MPEFHSVTDPATVKECLLISMEAMSKLKQEFTCVAFDLAMAKIAYNIIWNSPDKFKNVFVHLGGFHIMCSYMGGLGHMRAGSGFEEVLIEAGICVSGSINQVISGKH